MFQTFSRAAFTGLDTHRCRRITIDVFSHRIAWTAITVHCSSSLLYIREESRCFWRQEAAACHLA